MSTEKFSELNLAEELQRAVSDMGFEDATQIQAQSIPLILEGTDVIGHSQTGSGKTAAFGLPAVQMIDMEINPRQVQVLILCPTRELAVQACEEIKKFAKYKKGVNVVPVFGGQQIDRQILQLRRGCQIVVGTPGRIMDHMRRKTLKIQNIKMIILDEADEMLNMGFREDIETILSDTPEERQTVLFSATMPPAILEITKKFQNNPQHVKIEAKAQTVSTIQQVYYDVPKDKKTDVLCRLLKVHNPSLSIIFCNTKKMVDDLVADLAREGFVAKGLHGDMNQAVRTQVMNGFKARKFSILIATDVAARGIDVNDVEAVFNYDLPQDSEYYVHRIGRTGRAGKEGKSFTLIHGRSQLYQIKDIIRATKSEIVQKPLPTLKEVRNFKINQFTDELKIFMQNNDCSAYKEAVTALIEENSAEDIAAAIMAMTLREPEKSDDYAELYNNRSNDAKVVNARRTGGNSRGRKFDRNDKDRNGKSGRNERSDRDNGRRKSRPSENGMSVIKISIGKKDHIAPNHILGAVAGESGVPGKLIGSIDIQNSYTLVNVPKDHKKTIVDSLNNGKIKGKKVTVI